MDENMKIDQEQFLRLLSCYTAIQPYRAPDFSRREVGWYWYQEFKFRSLEELRRALDTHVRKHDHFPSIREMNQALSGKVDDDTISKVTSMNILAAIQKFGWCNWTEAKNYIGELGVKIVDRFGGWPNLCEMLTMDNFTYLQHQITEMTKSYLISGVIENNGKMLPSGGTVSSLISDLSASLDISTKPRQIESSVKELPW